MKKHIIFLVFIFQVIIMMAQNEKSQSPYFIVKGLGVTDSLSSMPLLATHADVNIAGVIADVQIKQVYHNNGEHPIEALYVFPASTNAAVYDMKMKVGKRIIQAKIEEKQLARKQYEQAKTAGKRTSLLEQERPNVFQMNVANIMTGDTIEVLLQYTELLVPEEGVYEFVYPAVVGPRYNQSSNNHYASMPYTQKGVSPSYDFGLNVRINGGMPIQKIQTNTHKAHYVIEQNDAMKVVLAPSEIKTGGNRDFILRYSFQGDAIQTGMITYDDGDEKFFLCMVQPPKTVYESEIPPREYIFVIDVSGSMRGFPLSVSKALTKDLISKLKPEDRFNILLFAGSDQLWEEELQEATPYNLERAIAFLDRLQGRGGTRLLPALKRSLNLNRCREDMARSIIVITDGYITVEQEAFELIRNNLNQANLFAFGIGSSVNRFLIEGMARAGQSTPFIVTDQAEAYVQAEKLRRYIQYPLLTQINTTFEDFEAYDLEPNILPDVMSERPILLFGKYKGYLKGKVHFTGYNGTENPVNQLIGTQADAENTVQLSIDVEKANLDSKNKALRYLWAREKIKNLSDYSGYGISEEDKKETTRLGLKYNLLTAYTSFIAIEQEPVRAASSKLKTVKQAIPLPRGVENSAVGFDLAIKGVSGAELLNCNKKWTLGMYASMLLILLFLLLLWSKRKSTSSTLFILAIGVFFSCEKEAVHEIIQTKQPFDEVSFILGKDQSTSSSYYELASTYFSTDSLESTPLIIKNCKSLSDVRAFLAQNTPANGAWKRINLIVHGNEWTGINLPITTNGERCTHESLEAAFQHKQIKALPDDIINQHTQVIIWGCNVGKDHDFLKSMSKILGGKDAQRPWVYAAPYFNFFKQDGNQYSRHLVESRFIAMPAGQFAGNIKIAKQFAQKYPRANIDWKTALTRLHPDDSNQAYTHYYVIPIEWTALYPSEKERPSLTTETDYLQWVKEQEGLSELLEEMQIDANAFRWEAKENNIKNLAALEVKGQSIIYCILSPLMDEKEKLFTPSIEDERYFSRVR